MYTYIHTYIYIYTYMFQQNAVKTPADREADRGKPLDSDADLTRLGALWRRYCGAGRRNGRCLWRSNMAYTHVYMMIDVYMYMHMCVYMYAYVYIYIYTHIYTCIYNLLRR